MIILVKLVVGNFVLNVVSAYAPLMSAFLKHIYLMFLHE